MTQRDRDAPGPARLVLHCGAFKTGSSRIQSHAYDARGELRDLGWLYPETGLITDEPHVGHRHSELVYRHRDPAVWNGLVADLVAEIRTARPRAVLLSSEAWSRPAARPSLTDLVAALRAAECVEQVHGWIYLRNRHDYARSLYRELARRRGSRQPFAEFVAHNQATLDPLEVVRALAAAVGPDGIQVWDYAACGDTAQHLFGTLGLPTPRSREWVNRGVNACDAEACRQLNVLAPEATHAFPGLATTLPEEVVIDPARYAERAADGQLAVPEGWVAEFRALTGWTAEQVDALLRPSDPAPRDVADLGPVLRGVGQRWLEEHCSSVIGVTIHPDPDVAELTVDPVAEVGSRWRLGGCLLPAGPVPPGTRVLAVNDAGEREVAGGLPSAAFARRHPGRPEAATARFRVARIHPGTSGRIELVLEHPSGRRSVLATFRRRWVPHPAA